MKYPIWEKFSVAARTAAATAEYAADRVTADGCCPLGIALAVDGVPHPSEMQGLTWTAPDSDTVSEALIDTFDDRDLAAMLEDEATLERLVDAFIADWDGGRISLDDLPALLEVDATEAA